MSEPLRLLIAANHPTVASGLLRKVRLALGRDIEAETLTSLVALRARMRTGNLPRIVVVDCALHGFDRRETMAALHLDHPAARMVALVQDASPRDEAELVRAGARAVLNWNACPRLTARVLEIVAAGSSYMSTAALLAMTGGSGGGGTGAMRIAPPLQRPNVPLTERETKILAHIRRGESNRVIGEALGLDENRIKIHLRAIFRKTGARNRTEAALRGVLAVMSTGVDADAAVRHRVPVIAPAAELSGATEIRAIA
jgi:two-component system nitrate/nitrite response regulator NarL